MRPVMPRRPGEEGARRDPAPSRLAYRLNRLWLRPLVRAAVRAGLPGFALAIGAGLWLAEPANRLALEARFAELRAGVEQRPEFMVTLMAIEGASPPLAEAIRAGLGLALPASSLTLDLGALRARLEAFDAVLSADLRVAPGGVLTVRVTERVPAALWRAGDGLWLIDAAGRRIAAAANRGLRPDLPLIAGEGAPAAVAEALALAAAAAPLGAQVLGLERIGQRRWDVALTGGRRLLLPADEPLRALDRIIALDAAEGLLARDIVAVDLRLPHRPTLRLGPAAAEALRAARRAAAERTSL